ncbi:saccharopine dehydrogenase NADP-binding domain-containing protein [Nonomuraea deserti]|uniref:saccharopine dehydrogenase NADP-binding domain-containing protein n=1 Tax=Nonomuraea deserti TaxID=1848322 RepID=UPI001405562D|nr:saccharopine dehydrogenase NADP-binding domain-containing protein [Nonomuraea deserti]
MIGILGGYGAVGATTALLLTGRAANNAAGRSPAASGVRVGGRDGAAARRFVAGALGGEGEAWQVDAFDPEALARFCRGCQVVVSCAGPSYLLRDRVARAAFAAGADYVDAAGDAASFAGLSATGTGGRTAVISAGMLPGLTGLLPRHLATLPRNGPSGGDGQSLGLDVRDGQPLELDVRDGQSLGLDVRDGQPLRLDVYTGGLDRLTPAAAGDFLLAGQEEQGAALAGWRDGGKVARALTPAHDVELPYFPGPVTAYPYLSAEAERVAADLGLAEARWYNVITGDRVLATASTATSAADLARVAELELAGRTPYYVLLFQLTGAHGTGTRTSTLVVRTADSYALTAAVAAHAARAVLAGDVPEGLHHADAVLDPARMLADLEGVATAEITDAVAPIDLAAPAFEEGAL